MQEQQPETIRLEIPTSPEYITIARKVIECIALRKGLTDQQVDDLKLAIGEACTNAIKFSNPNSPTVRILYRITRNSLEIEVWNMGKTFDHRDLKPVTPSIDRLANGGMGIFLMDQVMDELDIDSDDGETIVRMIKRFTE